MARRRRPIVLAAAIVAAVVLVIGLGRPGVAPNASSTPMAFVPIPQIPRTRHADLADEIRGFRQPGGAEDGTRVGGRFDTPEQDVVLLGEGIIVEGVPWLRVYVLPYQSGSGPDDFFTWAPIAAGGANQIVNISEAECPPTRDNISTLGALDAFTRARCLGATSFTVVGLTGQLVPPAWYEVEPAWLGDDRATAFSITSRPGDHALPVVVQPGVQLPPWGFTIEMTAHAGDPAARTCTRADRPDGLVPPEDHADSVLWCLTRIVLDRWTVRLGPEGRAIDPTRPQLHRYEAGGACAGVGMGPLRFRLDPEALDPVWLETQDGFRITPVFTDAFRAVFQPDLVLVDRTGNVVVRDGLVINPDGALAGHAICPTTHAVFFA